MRPGKGLTTGWRRAASNSGSRTLGGVSRAFDTLLLHESARATHTAGRPSAGAGAGNLSREFLMVLLKLAVPIILLSSAPCRGWRGPKIRPRAVQYIPSIPSRPSTLALCICGAEAKCYKKARLSPPPERDTPLQLAYNPRSASGARTRREPLQSTQCQLPRRPLASTAAPS